MALKYQKHTETKYTFTFTGRDFAKACFDAGVNAYKMGLATKRHIYRKKYKAWCAMGDRLIEVDKFTMDLILEVLACKSSSQPAQDASNK